MFQRIYVWYVRMGRREVLLSAFMIATLLITVAVLFSTGIVGIKPEKSTAPVTTE